MVTAMSARFAAMVFARLARWPTNAAKKATAARTFGLGFWLAALGRLFLLGHETTLDPEWLLQSLSRSKGEDKEREKNRSCIPKRV
jgi:hypothetical protein